jgi:succinate dehydrogenase/fumarate reductase cytochrome b subunit
MSHIYLNIYIVNKNYAYALNAYTYIYICKRICVCFFSSFFIWFGLVQEKRKQKQNKAYIYIYR